MQVALRMTLSRPLKCVHCRKSISSTGNGYVYVTIYLRWLNCDLTTTRRVKQQSNDTQCPGTEPKHGDTQSIPNTHQFHVSSLATFKCVTTWHTIDRQPQGQGFCVRSPPDIWKTMLKMNRFWKHAHFHVFGVSRTAIYSDAKSLRIGNNLVRISTSRIWRKIIVVQVIAVRSHQKNLDRSSTF